jgi:Fe2+ or Zn2+ uptake regulation protein
MINPYQYRSSKSRLTKQQELSGQISDQIIKYINTLNIEKDAETIWLEMREEGFPQGHSAFNNRLKRLVEAGFVEKLTVGYNKHFYKGIQRGR